MRAGALDRRIRIEHNPAPTRDPKTNELVDNWTTLCELWASSRPVQGGERFVAQQVIGEATTVWRIRWRPGITPLLRLVDPEGVAHGITAVQEIGRREGLDVFTKARSED